MPGLHRGPLDQRVVRLDVLVAEGGAAQPELEGHAALDLLGHASDLGLAEGAFVLGRDLRPDGQVGGVFALKSMKVFLKFEFNATTKDQDRQQKRSKQFEVWAEILREKAGEAA